MTRSLLVVPFGLLLLAGCAEKEKIDITAPIVGETATNAEKAYKRGMQEKADNNYIEATRYLEWVRNNFPYSQYAALAELALADMTYERDDFSGAAAAYQDFVKGHPSHPKADYAAFRVGYAWYGDRPSEFFLLPPAFEKDQTPLRSALDALQKFALQYPKSDYMPEARQLMDSCRDRLAAHERYVAEFYVKRQSWKGAAGRYLVLADQFGDLERGKVRDEGLWGASQAFRKLDAPDEEAAALGRFVLETQDAGRKREAEARLKELAPRLQKKEAPAEEGKAEGAKDEAPKAEVPKADAPNDEGPKPEAPKPAP